MSTPLLFDLDGTLWDTLALCVRGWNEAREELAVGGRPVRPEDIRAMMGLTGAQIRRQFLYHLPDPLAEKYLAVSLERTEQLMSTQDGELYPGVREGLARLGEKHPLFLVSNCTENYLKLFFDQTQLEGVFQDWECYGRTRRPKHENIRAVMDRNSLKTGIYVGDTATDSDAARRVGIPFYYLAYGMGDTNDFQEKFDSFEDLTAFVLALA